MCALIFSDIHIERDNDFTRPTPDGLTNTIHEQFKILDKIFEIAYDGGHEYIVFLGDFFHRWLSQQTVLFSATTNHLYYLLEKYFVNKLIVLPGNHDLPNKFSTRILTVDAWSAHPRITVVKEPCVLDIEGHPCAFIPYNQDHTKIAEAAIYLQKNGAEYIFSHLEIVGADASIENYIHRGGLSLDVFKDYQAGIFGHFHRFQVFDQLERRFSYIGSPLQLDKIEEGQMKVCGILTPNGDIEFQQLYSPKFNTITWDWGSPEYWQDGSDYWYIRTVAEGVEDIRRFVGNNLWKPIIIQEESLPVLSLPSVGGRYDSPLSSWIDQKAGELDKNLLMSMGEFYLEQT